MSFLVVLCVNIFNIRDRLRLKFSVRLKVLLTMLTSDDVHAFIRGVIVKKNIPATTFELTLMHINSYHDLFLDIEHPYRYISNLV